MKKTVNILQVAVWLLASSSCPLHASEPWGILAKSPGMIVSATLGPAGEVCVLEQLRFGRSSPGAADLMIFDLPPAERIFLSAGGGQYASIVYEGEGEMVSAARLTLYSSKGQQLWSVSHHPLNDVVPLETSGAVGLQRNINVLENQVYFFGEDGSTLKRMSVSALGEVKASPLGDHILINSGIRGALLFNAEGEMLSELGPAYRMTFSHDGRWVALLNGPKLTLYHEGLPTYVGELGGEIVRGAAFSPENSVVAAFTDHAFFLLKNPGGKVLLQRQLDANGELSYTSVDLTIEGTVIALGLERDLGPDVVGPERHPDGEVLVLRSDGTACHRKQVSYSRWNTTTPRVKFSADGEQLLVLTRDEVIKAAVSDLYGEGGVR